MTVVYLAGKSNNEPDEKLVNSDNMHMFTSQLDV